MPPRKIKMTPEVLEEMLKSETQNNIEAGEEQAEEPEDNNIVNNDSDFKDTIKNGILELSSLPMRGTEKRNKLKTELQNNKFINKYLDKQINKSYLQYMNDHIKAFMIYTYSYARVYRTL